MGVETLSFERFVCDRCEKTEDVRCGDYANRDRWGHATAQHYQGSQIFPDMYKATLCPDCCSSLRAWLSAPEAA